MLVTVAEMPEYIRRSKRLLDETERNNIINYLVIHPKTGVLIRGTGGIRKLRWSIKGKGKSSGVRIIYYYYDEWMPLYLLTIFGKGEKADLTKAERNKLSKLANYIVETHKKRKHNE